MSAHRVPYDLLQSPFTKTDPGDAQTITIDRDFMVVPIVNAGTETRTLAQPTKAGLYCTLAVKSTTGTTTVTITGGWNQAAATTVAMDTAGDWITFWSIDIGGSFYWRLLAQEGTDAADTFTAATITTLTATTINVTTVNATGVVTSTMTGASTTPGTVRAVIGAMTTFTSMTSGNLVGVRGSITMGGACSSAAYLYGVQGKAITGANTWSGTALAGVYAQIDVSGGTISSGHVAALQANIYGANSGTIPMEGIYVEHAGGGVINSLIQLFGKSTYVFDISSNTHNNVSTTGTPGAVTGGTGWIKCLVDGAVRYIPLASSVS